MCKNCLKWYVSVAIIFIRIKTKKPPSLGSDYGYLLFCPLVPPLLHHVT